jgi:O-antigen/teichoic acid export membrane protein
MPSPENHSALREPAGPGILKRYAYLLSARWVREAFQAVFLIYLARHSATTYGEFMLALAMGQILLLVAEFGLNLPLVPMLSQKEGNPGEALSRVSLLKTGLLLGASLGAVGFIHWQDYARPLQQVMLVLSAGVGLEALASTFFVACQVEGRQDLEGKVKVLGAGLGYGYGLLTLILGAAPQVVACFKLIETLVNLGGGAALIFSQSRFRPRWPSLRGLGATLQRSLVFALMEVTAITYNRANIFFLQRYAGAEGVAQYSATWLMVEGVSSLVSTLLLQSVMFPLFVRLWEVDRSRISRLAQDTARWLLAAALPVMFILFMESDRLITLIYGAHYQEAVWLQKYLVVTVVAAFLHNLAALLMVSMRRERLLLVFYLAGLIVNLLWCSLAMPVRPLLGAALAMVLTKGVVALMTVSYIQRRLGLITGRSFLQLAAAALGGVSCYLLGINHLPREVAEALALTPILGLGWHWWRAR